MNQEEMLLLKKQNKKKMQATNSQLILEAKEQELLDKDFQEVKKVYTQFLYESLKNCETMEKTQQFPIKKVCFEGMIHYITVQYSYMANLTQSSSERSSNSVIGGTYCYFYIRSQSIQLKKLSYFISLILILFSSSDSNILYIICISYLN